MPRGPLPSSAATGGAGPSGLVAIITWLNFMVRRLPAPAKILIADAVTAWADELRATAQANMNGPGQRPDPFGFNPNVHTTTGYERR